MSDGLKVIVLVKQVPNTADVKIDPKTGSLIREGVESIMNPEDRHGLESAVRLVETHGGSVIAVTMGPPQAVDVLTEALGMGADRGVLLTDINFAGADTWATSFTLASCLDKLAPFDLVVAGRQAIDGDTAQIGPQVAEWLGVPQITYVKSLEIDLEEGVATARRETDDGVQTVQTPLPALVTVLDSVADPRPPRIGALLAACEDKADITVMNAADIGVRADRTGLAGSFTNVIDTFSPKAKREGMVVEGSAEEMARELVQALESRNVV